MAHLVGLIITEDVTLRRGVERLLRSGPVPVTVLADQSTRPDAPPPDIVVIDVRNDQTAALLTLERLHGAGPAVAIIAIAHMADPDLILKTMRAGANEFLVLPLVDQTFQDAVRRMAARREQTDRHRHGKKKNHFFHIEVLSFDRKPIALEDHFEHRVRR